MSDEHREPEEREGMYLVDHDRNPQVVRGGERVPLSPSDHVPFFKARLEVADKRLRIDTVRVANLYDWENPEHFEVLTEMAEAALAKHGGATHLPPGPLRLLVKRLADAIAASDKPAQIRILAGLNRHPVLFDFVFQLQEFADQFDFGIQSLAQIGLPLAEDSDSDSDRFEDPDGDVDAANFSSVMERIAHQNIAVTFELKDYQEAEISDSLRHRLLRNTRHCMNECLDHRGRNLQLQVLCFHLKDASPTAVQDVVRFCTGTATRRNKLARCRTIAGPVQAQFALHVYNTVRTFKHTSPYDAETLTHLLQLVHPAPMLTQALELAVKRNDSRLVGILLSSNKIHYDGAFTVVLEEASGEIQGMLRAYRKKLGTRHLVATWDTARSGLKKGDKVRGGDQHHTLARLPRGALAEVLQQTFGEAPREHIEGTES